MDWIRSSDMIPPKKKEVLFIHEDVYHIGYIISYTEDTKQMKPIWFSEIDDRCVENVTHWMELPTTP